VSDWSGTSDWLRVKCLVFLICLWFEKSFFPLHLRTLFGLLFIFSFIERVDWVVIA
jgi:hypothetical protein